MPDGEGRAALIEGPAGIGKSTLLAALAGDELDGRASDGTGDGRSFSGWLGLLVAIDALLQNAPAEN